MMFVNEEVSDTCQVDCMCINPPEVGVWAKALDVNVGVILSTVAPPPPPKAANNTLGVFTVTELIEKLNGVL
jgi:hypothetical protein